MFKGLKTVILIIFKIKENLETFDIFISTSL